jgi:hypothetical protein
MTNSGKQGDCCVGKLGSSEANETAEAEQRWGETSLYLIVRLKQVNPRSNRCLEQSESLCPALSWAVIPCYPKGRTARHSGIIEEIRAKEELRGRHHQS